MGYLDREGTRLMKCMEGTPSSRSVQRSGAPQSLCFQLRHVYKGRPSDFKSLMWGHHRTTAHVGLSLTWLLAAHWEHRWVWAVRGDGEGFTEITRKQQEDWIRFNGYFLSAIMCWSPGQQWVVGWSYMSLRETETEGTRCCVWAVRIPGAKKTMLRTKWTYIYATFPHGSEYTALSEVLSLWCCWHGEPFPKQRRNNDNNTHVHVCM